MVWFSSFSTNGGSDLRIWDSTVVHPRSFEFGVAKLDFGFGFGSVFGWDLQQPSKMEMNFSGDETTLFNFHTSIFPPKHPSSPPTPSPTAARLRLLLHLRDLEDRHDLCLAHLHAATQQVEALRLENSRLRKANTDLINKRLDRKKASASLLDDLRRLSLVEDRPNNARVSFPKSISVRSPGYLKPPSLGTQRVNVPELTKQAGEEEESMEFEVYGQGMTKTELCNKWEETGECPYGDHCQFAHGIGELRPVIRHPRYKTEVCQMILTGQPCPYGHRCHFSHVLNQPQ